jgi:2-oxoisovalerate dehydrogenase E1 component alpha subunit
VKCIATADKIGRVLFPGALNSVFTDKLDFMHPSKQEAIPTYRVMNQYGEILDKESGVDTEDGEAIQVYKNMVKRQSSCRTWETSG